MLSRAVLISTCAFLFVATPALPQPMPNANPLLRVQTQREVAAPPTLRAAMRAWGLDRQNSRFRYAKRSITTDRAEFTEIVSGTGSATPATFGSLVITRNTVPGPNYGQFTVEARTVVTSNRDRIESVSLVGLRGAANLASLLALGGSLQGYDGSRPTASATDSMLTADRMTVTGLNAARGEGATVSTISIGELSVIRPIFGTGRGDFSGILVKDFKLTDSGYDVKLANLGLSDLTGGADRLLGQTDGTYSVLDLTKLSFGALNMDGLSVSFTKVGDKAPPLGDMSLSSLRLTGVRPNLWDTFEFSGLKGSGIAGRNPWQFSLGRVALAGINITYFSEIGNYFKLLFQSVRRADTKEPAPSSSSPRRTFKDIFPGGPLDGGVARFDLTDFRASGGGLDFELDQIGLRPQKNGAGIITKLDLIPTQMRLSWPHPRGSGAVQLTSFLSSLGSSEIVARFSLESSFNPATDLLALESYRFEVENWGVFDIGMTLSGLSAFMANTSVDDLAAFASSARTPSPATTRSELARMFLLYRDIRINSGQMKITDLGGIDKFARIGAVRTNGPASSLASQATPAQVRDIRLKWAAQPRAESGDKTKPPLRRQFGIAVARWLEEGGSMTFSMRPPTPLPVTEFEQLQALPPQRLGLQITNQAPPVSNR